MWELPHVSQIRANVGHQAFGVDFVTASQDGTAIAAFRVWRIGGLSGGGQQKAAGNPAALAELKAG
jgi:hypothetical protein